MKLHTIVAALGLGLIAPLGAQQVQTINFPAGTFSSDSLWETTGSAVVEEGVGKINLLLGGSGTLTVKTGPAALQPNSLYEIGLDITHDTLVGLGDYMAVEILDGSGNVIASLTGDQLLNLLGIDLVGTVTGLLGNLLSLDGALGGDLLVLGNLRDLLTSLLGGNGNLLDPSLLVEIQELLDSLVGQDPSVVSKLVELLRDTLGGDLLDPGSGLPLDLGDLLNGGVGQDLIAQILSLDLGGNAALITNIQDLLQFLLDPNNEGPVAELADVLQALLGGNLGDIDLLSDLLSTLLSEQDLINGVVNILNLELIQGDLLGNLTQGELLSLLGLRNPDSSTTQAAKLLFTTGATVPPGVFKVRLRGGAALAVGAYTFDNITIKRYNLVQTPVFPPDNDPTVDATGRPQVRPNRPRSTRRISKSSISLRGKAMAYGRNNAIDKVYAKTSGKGVKPKYRKFKKIRGRESWSVRVRVPAGTKARVTIYATDKAGQKSARKKIRVIRS